jgi:hypothetical protein
MKRVFYALFVPCLLLPAPVLGYGGDTHYYLRFASALEACFDWDEAHLIASADYLVDKNRSTTAEKQPFQKYNKIHWHAFGRDEERFNELWERVLAETDPDLQLVKLGQYLHFITDWESHFGYGVRMGHGIATFMGRDPDSLGANRMNNLRMIDQTIDHMIAVCVARGDDVWEGDRDLLRAGLYKSLADENLLDEMFLYNSRKWKSWGVRGKKGRKILARNHLLIEQLIQARSAGHPERGVPEDFAPGDPDHGLPPPIGLRYEQDGTLVEVYGVELELLPEYAGDPYDDAEEDALEESLETDLVDDVEADLGVADDSDIDSNLELEVLDADLEADGWSVSVELRNLGSGPTSDGQVEVVILDVITEDLLAEATRPFHALRGREKLRMHILVEAPGKPSRGILIGATANNEDLSADNNSAWFVPWREEIRADEGKNVKRERTDLPVEILGTPHAWIDASGDLGWVVARALVSGGHSSRRLQTLRISLDEGSRSADVNVEGGRPTVWLSVPDLRRRVVPAETLSWFPIDPALCAKLQSASIRPAAFTLTLEGPEIRTTAGTFPVDEPFRAALQAACLRKEARS